MSINSQKRVAVFRLLMIVLYIFSIAHYIHSLNDYVWVKPADISSVNCVLTSGDGDCIVDDVVNYSEPKPNSVDEISSSNSGVSSNLAKVNDDADVDDNVQITVQYFVDKGLSLTQASGIAGNLEHESGLNPAKIQNGAIASDNYKPIEGKGFGIAQWSSAGRQYNLVKLAKDSNRKVTDLYLQLDFVWWELHNSQIDTMLKLKNTTTPMEAAIVFHNRYERSADSRSTVAVSRGGNAERIYEAYK